MASMFESLLERAANLPSTLHQLFTTSSSSSSCSQLVGNLEKLHRRMKRIRALLNDAEEREIREERVKLWLDELRDVAYDAEDVLGEVEYESLRCRLGYEEGERGIGRKRKVSDSPVTPPTSPMCDASFQQKIVAKIKTINDQFAEIYDDRCMLELREDDGQRLSASILEPPLKIPTSCLVDEQGIRGRDGDKNEVIDMLLSFDDSDCNENVRVLSIVGMGGVGKTTLAQLVFNDAEVANHFEKRLWVCVSETFDVTRLTKEILEEILGAPSLLQGFDSLQQSLRSELQLKRFLLVLDDIWNENHRHWEALWVTLLGGAKGSRVLITTRSETVSRTSNVSEENMYRLGCLSEEDSWSLFEQHAFGGKSSDDYPELASIGREIVKKCKGLPLAVKTLAGLLFCEFREDRWEDVLRSELWELSEGKDHILPALKLSYHNLPSPIKPCFAYCAVFPKDHRFKREQLVNLWMAQGYMRPMSRRCMEDVGRKYFEDLLQRSFFQETTYGDFVMHDLIHDLALSIWSGECCEVVDGNLSNSNKARHLFFKCGGDIRRFLSCGPTEDPITRSRTCYLDGKWSWEFNGDLFMRMKYLRVLHLSNTLGTTELLSSVGNLKHLRYLHITRCFLTSLPESLCNLLNLQTLQVMETPNLENLPKSLKDLVHLRHLNVYSRKFSVMPSGIGRLTQLRMLPVFVVGEGSGAAGIEELTTLNNLQGELEVRIRSLKNLVGGHDDYGRKACILKNKVSLESLILNFPSLGDRFDDESVAKQRVDGEPAGLQDDVSTGARRVDDESAGLRMNQQQQEQLAEHLEAPTNIKELEVHFYGGGRFPKWMGNPSYKRLERIHLSYCHSCRLHLPSLGQLPHLKYLNAYGMGALESGGRGFLEATSFPSLKVLHLGELYECEELSVGTEGGCMFPCLRILKISDCWQLKYVKLRQLAALFELNIHGCQDLRKLDYDNDKVSVSHSGLLPLSPLSLKEQEVLADVCHTHIPSVCVMELYNCPKLSFSPEQQLPQSLWRFDAVGSPLLSEWLRNHGEKLLGIRWLLMDDGPRLLLSLRNVQGELFPDMEDAEDGYYDKGCEWDVTFYGEKLELRWDVEQQNFSSSPTEAERFLADLHTAEDLEELIIEGYRGLSFPDWVGHPDRLSKLVKITLCGCIHCESLPPLGELPSLQQLHISGMPEIRYVGDEFCVEPNAFPSLQTLLFDDMPEWEEWLGVEDGAFAALQFLRIRNCPKLTTLQLSGPLQLRMASGHQCFGTLSELHISGLSSLSSVSLPFWAAQGLSYFLHTQGSSISISWASTGSSRPLMPVIQVEGDCT